MSRRTLSIQFCCELAGREVPTFPGASWGPKGKGRSVVLAWNGVGGGGEGSRWGCWVHLFSLCGVQRQLIKEACGGQNPACAPSQKGTCFSKDASCPFLVGLTCHHCTAKKVLESRSPQPGMCLPRNHDKKCLERCPVHICSSWRGKQPIQTGWKKMNEFPDCSILLPGP